MSWADVGELIGLYMGAFGLGWCSGFAYLVFRKVAESAT